MVVLVADGVLMVLLALSILLAVGLVLPVVVVVFH